MELMTVDMWRLLGCFLPSSSEAMMQVASSTLSKFLWQHVIKILPHIQTQDDLLFFCKKLPNLKSVKIPPSRIPMDLTPLLQLRNLRDLSIDASQLSPFSAIQQLHLNSLSISGHGTAEPQKLPDETLKQIAVNFSQLELLELVKVALMCDQTPVMKLTNLKTLRFRNTKLMFGNSMVGLVDVFLPATTLEELEVFRVFIPNEDYSAFPNLKRLVVSGQPNIKESEWFKFETLTRLTNLQILSLKNFSLWHNELFTDFGLFTNLNELTLAYCSYITNETLASIGTLPDLLALDLTGCKDINDFEPLARLYGLTSLVLSGTAITTSDLQHIERCTRLKVLNLSSTSVGTTEKLTCFEKLESLNLSQCHGQLPSLNLITSLTELRLVFQNIKDVGILTSLKKLRILDLESNNLAEIDGLQMLTNLTSLNLDKNRLDWCSAENFDVLCSYLSGLTELSINHVCITPRAYSTFGQLLALKSVKFHIRSRESVEPLMASLLELTNLRNLLLDGRSFTDEHLTSLKNLRKLRKLELGAGIQRDGLRHLVDLNISKLNIENCQMSVEINWLAQMKALTFLKLCSLEPRQQQFLPINGVRIKFPSNTIQKQV